MKKRAFSRIFIPLMIVTMIARLIPLNIWAHTVMVNDNDLRIQYHNDAYWIYYSDYTNAFGFYNNDERYGYEVGSYIEFVFTGTGIT